MTRDTHVRRDGEALAVGQRQQLAVVEHRVEILDPLRVDVAVEDDPLTLADLAAHVVDDLAQRMREQTCKQRARACVTIGNNLFALAVIRSASIILLYMCEHHVHYHTVFHGAGVAVR